MRTAIFWFRRDLRLDDNPGLFAAAESDAVLPIYIWEHDIPAHYQPGGASQWWLQASLKSLNKDLDNQLNFYQGNPTEILPNLIQKYKINSVYWNRIYEPWHLLRDKDIAAALEKLGVDVNIFNASLLWEPSEIVKKDGLPYQVFTPFYQKGCLQASSPRQPFPKPNLKKTILDKSALSLEQLSISNRANWHEKLRRLWIPGEKAAQMKFEDFLNTGLVGYAIGRDFPSRNYVSRLSPHLHFGEISPNQIWHTIYRKAFHEQCYQDSECFLKELGWREFSHYLLYHYPDLPTYNYQRNFDRFPWSYDSNNLRLWQKGCTGYPIIDAGMRELWETGYMHNRVRMIVASFLIKNLLIDWREGARWFWDCLVDADLANNSASWQWVAGCGADAAPYFRIFNPIIQAKKFDPDNQYIHQFVPELRRSPFDGSQYSKPIIDLDYSRERALKAFASISK